MSIWPAGVARTIGALPESLGAALRATAARRGEALAIAFYGAEISFAELLARVERLAAHLQHACGLAPGDRALLDMQNSPHAIIAYQAIARAGGVVVPVNPMSMPEEIAYLAEDSGARVALIGAELVGRFSGLVPAPLAHVIVAAYGDEIPADTPFRLPPVIGESVLPEWLQPGFVAWNEALAETRPPRPDTSRPDDLCVMPYTSGTTGKPKACLHTHHSVLFTAFVQARWYFYDDETVLTGFMPMFHVAGMQLSLNGCAACGATVVVMARWDRDLVAPLFKRYGVTLWSAAPTMVVDALAADGFDQAAFARLKTITGGGAAMPAAVAAELKRRWNLAYVEGYGLTETMSPSHLNPVDRPKPQCLGVPVQETHARIIDPGSLAVLPQGETGEIVIAGPQVMRGYWNLPEATAEAFVTLAGRRFLRTGDLARIDDEGYFHMVDRLKRMISVSGFKVWPSEVEAVLYRHPAVQECCIVSAPDAYRGETVKALVVRRPGCDLTAEELIAWAREVMAAYKVPRLVAFVDALPRTASNKLDWRSLQDAAWATGAG
ncbi:long-chain-fatty-acid--CoA ligase [Phreatobacter sp.]|uniref:long-chain-fatty-acid--CoA ligase n=1 Tax=Phreatobacter sp. TaxID=1966341 RepID=UPI0025FDCD13|nr:long-chain-fatty-acid--CoA ligase [Phreatobacter sp.]